MSGEGSDARSGACGRVGAPGCHGCGRRDDGKRARGRVSRRRARAGRRASRTSSPLARAKAASAKTTVAVNLAIALAKCGSRVGIIDGDIYGPNVPIMLGINTQLTTDGKKIIPAEKHGIQVISMGFMTSDDSPVIWRGPMLHGAIQQFFREVRWNNLDYLIVDMPPERATSR